MPRTRYMFTELLVLLYCSGLGSAYHPVIIMHGVLMEYQGMEELAAYIKDAHPGTDVYNVNAYNNQNSLQGMWTQVKGVQAIIQPILDNATDGVNMICYSQGGLICRGILEKYPNKVKTFISLSSPQAGQYGDTEYLKYLFPNYTKEHIYSLFYSKFGQRFSVANYWNDPHHQMLYKQYCAFLPFLNNGSNPDYKKNFLSLEQLVLIGGPDDGVITPWQSSHFAFYDENEKVVPMTSQLFYVNDMFGLKTLNMAGRVKVFEVPGVQHLQWHHSKPIFQQYIEPYLK